MQRTEVANLKGGSHPLRVRILSILATSDEALSPKELCERTGATLGTTAYHLRMLAGYGAIELERVEPRRGALQHFYRLTEAGEQAERRMRSAVDSAEKNPCIQVTEEARRKLVAAALASLRASEHYASLNGGGLKWAKQEAERLAEEMEATLRVHARA